jgi:Ca-activated chloride channel family protein
MMMRATMLHLLWAAPVIVALHAYAVRKRRRALRRFASRRMLALLTSPAARTRRAWKALGACLAFALVVVALARPAWNPQPRELRRRGRDLVFVLDISRSMLAEDVAPSRLESAKRAILDCLGALHGDRVGLVAFAGEAAVQCPLTLDYAFFRMRLEDVGPRSVAQGGTRIGHALDTVFEKVLTRERPGFQDVILITDGEGHDGAPAQNARRLDQAGARLIAIGVGDPRRGGRISVSDPETGREAFLTHDDQEVWTRLRAESLRRMVGETSRGVYVHAATGAPDVAGVYGQLIAADEQREFEGRTILRYDEKFQVFLAAAFALLFAGALAGEPRRRLGVKVLPLLLLLALSPAPAGAASTRKLLAEGNAAYAETDYEAAAAAYQEALSRAPDSAPALYNLGSAYYRQGDYESAVEAYESALYFAKDPALSARARHNIGNCLFRQAEAARPIDRGAAREMFLWSAHCYGAALELDRLRADSARNLELARLTIHAIGEEIRAEEERQRELQQALSEIAAELAELIERQEAAAATCKSLMAQEDAQVEPLAAEQRAVERDTRLTAGKIEALESRLPGMPAFLDEAPPDVPSPLAAVLRHVLQAAEAQGAAGQSLEKGTPAPAYPLQREAVRELKQALEAMPKPSTGDPGEDQEGDEEFDEESDEDDTEYEESDEEGDRRAPRPEAGETDAEDDEFTAPLESPEDILEEERRSNEQRQKKRPESRKAAEKDW